MSWPKGSLEERAALRDELAVALAPMVFNSPGGPDEPSVVAAVLWAAVDLIMEARNA